MFQTWPILLWSLSTDYTEIISLIPRATLVYVTWYPVPRSRSILVSAVTEYLVASMTEWRQLSQSCNKILAAEHGSEVLDALLLTKEVYWKPKKPSVRGLEVFFWIYAMNDKLKNGLTWHILKIFCLWNEVDSWVDLNCGNTDEMAMSSSQSIVIAV